jgi:hypothetical protein
LGRASTDERNAALDNLCRLAARTTGAPVVIVIEWASRNAAKIRGATGTNVRTLTGNSCIPRLDRAGRPLVSFLDLRSEPWFPQHALHTIDPYAKVLIAADVMIPGSPRQAALVAINPSPRPQRDGSTIAILSELASIAGYLLSTMDDRDVSDGNSKRMHSLKHASSITGLHDGDDLREGDYLSTAEPLLFFLRKTLVKRRALRARNSVHYVTLRQWKEAVKDAQIAALRAIKSQPSNDAVGLIASEIADAARELYPGMPYACVVPVPCGSSGKDKCLSTFIGESVAAILGVPFRPALRGESSPGASHPHKSAKMKSYQLLEPLSGNVLLVDDVATTGMHVALAASALRAAGTTVFPIVWISA